MALQQSKMSKMKKRMRKGANRYRGIQTNVCPNCGAARLPHRVCLKCGMYAGRQVVATDVNAD
ncbi:MAG: 50S ribosomal protein L32 [Lentisphaeria bacterium]|jgi:large subunit ribosomal protein L32